MNVSACGYAAWREFGQSGVRSKQWATHARDLPLSKPDYYIFPAVGSTVVEFLAGGDHMAADSSPAQRREDRKVSQTRVLASKLSSILRVSHANCDFPFFSEIFLGGEKTPHQNQLMHATWSTAK